MSHEQIENALVQLLEGFESLQEEVELAVLGKVEEVTETSTPPTEEQLDQKDEQFFASVQSAVGKLAESGRCQPGDLLAMISAIAEALEDYAPELFEEEEIETKE